MTLTEIAVVYLWLVLATSLALVAFVLLQPDVRSSLRGIFVGLYYLVTQEKDHFDSVDDQLHTLLRSGLNTAVLIVRARHSNCRLKFEKYIRSPGVYGIKLVLPIAIDASGSIPGLRQFCANLNLPCRLMKKHDDEIHGVLYITCGQDIAAAQALARHIWTDFHGLPEHARYRTDMYNVAYGNQLVDRPGQEVLTFSQLWDQWVGPEGPRPVGCVLEVLLKLFGIFLHFALPISLLAGSNENPDWSLDVGRFSFAGTTGSLVLFLLYIGRLIAKRHLNALDRSIAQKRQGQELFRHQKLVKSWFRTVGITLPLSALIIWSGA